LRSDEVLNSPRLLNLPLLLLANKQDAPTSLAVSEIRESFDAWQRARPSRTGDGADDAEQGRGREWKRSLSEVGETTWDDGGARDERMASLDVMGVSALEGWVLYPILGRQLTCGRNGVRDAVDWLYVRVQDARKMWVLSSLDHSALLTER